MELIVAAKRNAARGQPQEAARLLRRAEMEAPRHPLVLNEIALRMFKANNPAGAVVLLEQAIQSDPSNIELRLNLAFSLRRIGRLNDALATLEKLLETDSHNLNALLEKGSLEEALGKPRAAAMSYRTALQAMPPGFQAPSWLEPALRHAAEQVAANNRALEIYIEEKLRPLRARHPEMSFGRFNQCVETILQKRRIWRQRPSFMYFPGLPAIEFYERDRFPWLDALDEAADDIRAELMGALEDGPAELEPYVADPPGVALDTWSELNHSRRWSVYSLWREGTTFPEHIANCPRTVAALGLCPRWDVPGSGPTALFSILEPKTHIPAHSGPVNTRLVVHLPLIVPPGCKFRVGGETREWHPGEALVFDDSIDHEAWNDSDQSRAVLIFDIWSPFLSLAERDLIRALTVRIGEFYATTSSGGI